MRTFLLYLTAVLVIGVAGRGNAVAADIFLTVGSIETGDFGNRFSGRTDADGVITANFESGANDLTLSVVGYDIDFADEVQVRLNGASLGYLQTGPNDGLTATNSFAISAISGTNTLTFEQTISDSYKWGITDILLTVAGAPPEPSAKGDIALTIGQTEGGDFGNSFNGQSDADGIVTATFDGSGNDLVLSVVGYDIDFANEVQLRLNGSVLGFLRTGPNNELTAPNVFAIPAGEQLSGTNTLTFEQTISDSYRWGVSDLLLDVDEGSSGGPTEPPPSGADTLLTVGQKETGEFGNNYNGASDADGVITARFEGTSDDLVFSVIGYDIDFANEVQLRLNGLVVDFLRTGPNNGLTAVNKFSIAAGDQRAGSNTLVFEQMISDSYRWGVTDFLLEIDDGGPADPPPSGGNIVLAIGQKETGEFGNNYNGANDADGVITATFQGTSDDLVFSVVGYDIDFVNEVQVRLNGTILDFIRTGPNNGLTALNEFAISAGEQRLGTNTLTFEQMISDSYRWGITDLLLEVDDGAPTEPPPSASDIELIIGQKETGEFGNNYNGMSDLDGVITASFEGTAKDLVFSVIGYDIDFANEVQIRLNGAPLGFLRIGPNNGLSATNRFPIAAGDQESGTNTLTFEQMISDGYRWGITDLLLQEDSGPPVGGKRPDIIILVADDLGAADIGPERRKSGLLTPNLDALADAGITFTHGYAQPACTPARAALLAGKWPQRRSVGPVNKNGPPYAPARMVTIAERLKPLGYTTHLVGKWHLGFDTGQHPLDQGFDTFFGFEGFTPDYEGHDPDRPLYRQRTQIENTGNVSDTLGTEAVRLLRQNRSDPMFMFVSWTTPHHPLQGTLEQRIEELDRNSGRIIDAAKPDTLFVFLGDNGRACCNSPFRGRKYDILEGGVRVPFSMRWSGRISPNQTVSTPASIVDVAVTVIEAAGGTFKDTDGYNLAALPANRPIFFQAFDTQSGYGVRRGRWKLYKNYEISGFQLYNILSDKDESNNVAGSNPSVVSELNSLLDGFITDLAN